VSCQNGHGARAILSALRSVDPTLPESDQKFWHKTLGTQGGGTVKAAPEDSLSAIDAAWVAATKNNKAWSNLTPQERLGIQGEFRDLRSQVEDGSLSLTQNQVMKLGAYTAKHKKLPMITRVGVGLSAVLVGGLTMVSPAAAATTDGPIAATKANASLTHVRAKDGNCPTDFTLAKAKGTHKVTWQYPSKKVGVKKIKKGQQVCIYQGQKGVYKDGVLVALPANFPKNPTAADIAALGLTRDTPVDPNLRIPQPKSGTYFEEPELADYVTPIAFVGQGRVQKTYMTGRDPVTGEVKYTTADNPYYLVEWEYRGGKGILETATEDGVQSYKLQPDGAVRVVTRHLVDSGQTFSDGTWATHAESATLPDYGQSNLPQSAIQDWDFMRERAFGPWKGIANFPTGKRATPSNQYSSLDRDGTALFNPATGEKLGNLPPLWER
jgi:hypothetical protein